MTAYMQTMPWSMACSGHWRQLVRSPCGVSPLSWQETDPLSADELDTGVETQVATIGEVFQQMEEHVHQQLLSKQGIGLLPSQRGRCQPQEPHMAHRTPVPTKLSRPGDEPLQYCGESFKHAQWTKQLRRLQSLTRLLRANQHTSDHREHASQLWLAIRKAKGFPSGFAAAWTQRSVITPGSPVNLPTQVPTLSQAESICAGFLVQFRALEKALRQARQDQAKERRAADPNVVYRDVAKQQALPVQTVVTKRFAAVAHVDNDHKVLQYPAGTLDTSEPVYADSGMLQPAEHLPGILRFDAEQLLAEGDLLTQWQPLGDIQEVFQEFKNLWDPMWNRHKLTTSERWTEFLDLLTTHLPPCSQQMPWAPITLEDWDLAIKSKKPRSAPGPDGVTRQDLQHMPRQFRVQLVRALQAIEAGEMAWPAEVLEGHVALVEKHSLAATAGEFRPITVLGMVYRTWGTFRARQIIQWISDHGSDGLQGNRKGYSSTDVWWQLQAAIEHTLYEGGDMTGMISDIVKCYNNIPRPVVFACGLRLGVPKQLLWVWHAAIGSIERRFIVDQRRHWPVSPGTQRVMH